MPEVFGRRLTAGMLFMAWAWLVCPDRAVSQGVSEPSSGEGPRLGVGLDLLVADPVGEFARRVDQAFGLEVAGWVPLDEREFVSLRGEFGFLVYGYETRRVCVGGTCRVQADLETSNHIVSGGLGPELGLSRGRVRLYTHALLGFAYFSTSSSLKDSQEGRAVFTTENFGDGTFCWGVGGGVRVRLSAGRVPVGLNLGARYHRNGVMEYLTEGDIQDNPDGSITLYPNRSEANYLTFRLGVTLGVPLGGHPSGG